MIDIYGVYGKYAKLRNASWQLLVDCNINELPVNIISILSALNIYLCKNSDTNKLKDGEYGVSFLIDGQWYIVYDDTLPFNQKLFTLAHELGHILLGHPLKKEREKSKRRSTFETQADMFAIRLLSPTCVLWALDLHTPQEISKICQIDINAAKIRAERMEVLYERNKFLTSSLERKVYHNFSAYIEEQKKKR